MSVPMIESELISPADIARLPRPGMAGPTSFAYSPDDRHLAFLYSPDGSLQRALFLMQLSTGEIREVVPASAGWANEADLALEHRLLRERTGENGLGVIGFTWADSVDRMLVPLPDGLYVLDPAEEQPRCFLASDGVTLINPQLSPDGRRCAFVRDSDLWMVDVDGPSEPQRLTWGGGSGIAHGVAEYIAQSDRYRFSGFWWSPHTMWIAYTEVDERAVSSYSIPRLASEGSEGASTPVETYRQPFAGTPNAVVSLGVMPAGGGSTVWMDLSASDHYHYLLSVRWASEMALYVQSMSRDQSTLELRRFDAKTGTSATVHTERSDTWINPHDDFRLLNRWSVDTGAFLWSSERSGFRHLELRGADGRLAGILTSGDWMVDRLLGVDEARGLAYFACTREGATQRHAYSVPLAGGELVRLTEGRGIHDVVVSHSGTSLVDTFSALDRMPTVRVRPLQNTAATAHSDVRGRDDVSEKEPSVPAVDLAGDPRTALPRLSPPELVTVEARDGTKLDALVYRPVSLPAPGVVDVYGGPLAQRVADSWDATADLRAQALRQLGYCVLKLDNRGSARRGVEFEAAVRHRLGQLEVLDQLDGVAWAVAEGLIDPDRVAVYGWSYGGYMALRCLAAAPEVFRVAIAGAPITSWEDYESYYTEFYMGTQQENPAGYAASSVLIDAHRLSGQLLLMHGLMDENVHFRHSARLIQALIAADQDYQLLVLPEERHHVRQEASRRMIERRVIDFLIKNLA